MPHKVIPVHFYAVGPQDSNKPVGGAPDDWLDRVDGLPRESGGAYLSRSFWTRMLCDVHGSGPRMLGAWMVDTLNPPHTERKGVIEEIELFEDEGVAFATWVMFFPGPVAGVIRSSAASPGPAGVADYLNHFTQANCELMPIADVDTIALLERGASEALSATFKINLVHLDPVRSARADMAEALEAAARPAGSRTVTVKYWCSGTVDKADWWSRIKSIVTDLYRSGALESFETARVSFSGKEDVDLLSQRVTIKQPVEIDPGHKRLVPASAAIALVSAFKKVQPMLSGS